MFLLLLACTVSLTAVLLLTGVGRKKNSAEAPIKIARPNTDLSDGWVLAEVRKYPHSFISLCTLKRGESQTIFARLDLGKQMPVDPVPSAITGRMLARAARDALNLVG